MENRRIRDSARTVADICGARPSPPAGGWPVNRTGIDRRHDAKRYGAGRRVSDLRTRIAWRISAVTLSLAWVAAVIYLVVSPHV